MALDTNLTPEIVNSFNVYIDGVKAIGTAPEITLPQITSETIDVSGAGILGKISAPNIGQFESIEQEVSFNLVYSSFVNVLSPKRQVNLTFRVAQQAVDKSLGYAYKGLRIVEVGRVKEFTPGKIKAGEGMEAKVKLKAVRPSKETASCRLPMQASDKYIPLRWAIPAGCSPLP